MVELCDLSGNHQILKSPFIINSQKVRSWYKKIGPTFHKLQITENMTAVPRERQYANGIWWLACDPKNVLSYEALARVAQGCSAKKRSVIKRTWKTSHFQQHFKLIFKSGFNEVFTFIALQTKIWKKCGCVFLPHCTLGWQMSGSHFSWVAVVLGSNCPRWQLSQDTCCFFPFYWRRTHSLHILHNIIGGLRQPGIGKFYEKWNLSWVYCKIEICWNRTIHNSLFSLLHVVHYWQQTALSLWHHYEESKALVLNFWVMETCCFLVFFNEEPTHCTSYILSLEKLAIMLPTFETVQQRQRYCVMGYSFMDAPLNTTKKSACLHKARFLWRCRTFIFPYFRWTE